MAKLKPWYQTVTPREDLRENKPLDASEFAVHLDQVRVGTAPEVYTKPAKFFERTYMTSSLLSLSAEVLKRLSGIKVETSAIFNMATQFGGGKTHSLTALMHLARGGPDAASWKGVDQILGEAGLKEVPQAKVAAFVGDKFDALKGRGGNGEQERKTPWGEIAWQLGGQESFDVVADHDARGIAPGGDLIEEMLPGEPCLILIDEMMNYVMRARPTGIVPQLHAFIQNLTAVAAESDHLVLCVSIPSSSETELPEKEDRADYEAFKKMLDRTGKAIAMSGKGETAEIIRRRLFEWDGLNKDAIATVRAYAEWATEYQHELANIDGEQARKLFESTYPFHPAVISVFERKWQSLPRFQRTRGVLRLLALWVSRAYQQGYGKASGEPLLQLGSAPLDDRAFRDAVFEQLGEETLKVPVETDIAGRNDSHSLRLDEEGTPNIKKLRLHQKVATSIFFESNGGMAAARAEATLPELKMAIGGPEFNWAELDSVLEGLLGRCFYLVAERNRYRFGLNPNLNQMLVHRRANVRDTDVEERIKREINNLFNVKPQDHERRRLMPELRFFPTKSNDIPDRAQLTLAVLGFDTPEGEGATKVLMQSIIRECGSSGRTYKSGVFFATPESSSAVTDDARSLLAWEDIEDDSESVARLDESQKKTMKINLGRAEKDLKESLYRAYRHVFMLDKDNSLAHEDLGQITSSVDPSIANMIVAHLLGKEIITKSVGATKLVRYWPPALEEWSTKAVRDAFFASPSLPRLLDGESLKRTVADGVSQGLVGYGHKDAEGRLHLDYFEESVAESEIEISDDVFIFKGDHAKRLKEPPRLAGIAIRPNPPSPVKVGDTSVFHAMGQDQYGGDFPLESVDWSCSGGTIDVEGKFVAGNETGNFEVSVTSAGCAAHVPVRVIELAGRTSGGDGVGGGAGDGQMLLWSGDVPAQKWMNFYTKVLARFATSPDLKLRVSVETNTDDEQAQRVLDETRSALRELGLNEDAHLS